jgi:hypothetical protein
MPLSSHLLRKLQEAIGMDAADEFSNIVDTYEAMRADLAEFRHETRRDLEVIKVRMDGLATKAELAETKAELAETKSALMMQFETLRTESQALRAELQTELRTQTQWALGAVMTVLLAIFFSR